MNCGRFPNYHLGPYIGSLANPYKPLRKPVCILVVGGKGRCLLRLSFRAHRCGFTVEARKLEHDYPHALKVKYKGS